MEMIRSNFLYDILDNAGSLTEHTGEKLEEWKEYLQWKMELAKRQIYGCKYYKVAYDDVKKRLNFWLIFEDKENLPVIELNNEFTEYNREEFELLKERLLRWKENNEI